MQANPDKNLRELRDQVVSAQYRVDPVAVADAIVRRRWSVFIAPEAAPVCSIAARRWQRSQQSSAASRSDRGRTDVLAA